MKTGRASSIQARNGLLGGISLAIFAVISTLLIYHGGRTHRALHTYATRFTSVTAGIVLISHGGGASAQLPPPTAIGMNASAVRYYGSTFPFENQAVGSQWLTAKWAPLPESYQDSSGDILAMPPDGAINRFLLIPITGPGGMDVICTYLGSGSLSVGGSVTEPLASTRQLKFHVLRRRGEHFATWITVKGVDRARPMRRLDCRDTKVARSVVFRPKFLETMRGFPVIRFMDWQNANANSPVTWETRHPAGANRSDQDGVAIEDMMALTRELGASPWFVIPWNADDDYIQHFAELVRDNLPTGRSVYIEASNEVWNYGFSVSKQAAREAEAEGLKGSLREVVMHRYAERAVAVMKIWERVFAHRAGLVRVLSSQHAVPDSAQTSLSWKDTAQHVDALATAPYFGPIMGGTGFTADVVFQRMQTDLQNTLVAARQNRDIAHRFGKRYIAYEGGQGLVLPVEEALQHQVQYDPRMYKLYKQYLGSWKKDDGDLLCLFNRIGPISRGSAWGLTEYEDETPAEAPKLRAVLEER